jgi:hypothetical protein
MTSLCARFRSFPGRGWPAADSPGGRDRQHPSKSCHGYSISLPSREHGGQARNFDVVLRVVSVDATESRGDRSSMNRKSYAPERRREKCSP